LESTVPFQQFTLEHSTDTKYASQTCQNLRIIFANCSFFSFSSEEKIENVFITSSHILTNPKVTQVSLREWLHAEIFMEEHQKSYKRSLPKLHEKIPMSF
jgi:hypothetical protein